MTEDKRNANGEAEDASTGAEGEPEQAGAASDDTRAANGGDDADPVAELEAELARTKDQALRALAEAENTRRRAEKERHDASKYGAAGLARDMLGVADNLRRALEAVDPKSRENDAVDALVTGVEMTERMLLEAFEKHEIKRIDPLGEPFDHNYHQAMMEVDSDAVEGGHVAQVMQPGYVLHDRLIRPAMVAVAKKKKGGDADGDKPSVDTTV